MFGDHDEKELELLRMYDAEQDEGSNSDTSEGLDSDEENKILSVLNYQSNFDAVKPVTNQSAIHTSNQTLKKPVQQTKYDKLLPTGSDSLEHKETKGVSNGKMAANSTIDKQEVIVNYIDMNAQIEVQEKPKESNSVERNRKLQTLINKGIEQASFDQRRPERLCSTCFFPDHQAMDCKRCYICGGPKHTTSTCVGLEYCKRCKRRGHNEKDCEDRYRDRDCNICKVEYHRSQECPSLLHRYDGVMPPAEEMASYCYHCAESGHYGDECPNFPSWLAMSPTAFSKYNEGDFDRYTASFIRIFSRHYSSNDRESERDRSRTSSRRRRRSPSESRSPRRRRSRSPRRHRSRSPKRRRSRSRDRRSRSRSRDRRDSSSHSTSRYKKVEMKDCSTGRSSKSSTKQSSTSSAIQSNKFRKDSSSSRKDSDSNLSSKSNSHHQPSRDIIVCISDGDSTSQDTNVEPSRNDRESSVDSRASSIERARTSKNSRV